jgi:hypothetical protein
VPDGVERLIGYLLKRCVRVLRGSQLTYLGAQIRQPSIR